MSSSSRWSTAESYWSPKRSKPNLLRNTPAFGIFFSFVSSFVLHAQVNTPFLVGQSSLLPPAIDSSGTKVVFGASTRPSGDSSDAVDLYLSSGLSLQQWPRKSMGITAVALTPDAAKAVYTSVNRSGNPSAEEVHITSGAGDDRTIAVDTQGCIQPLVACVNCFFSCLRTPHISPDGAKVLYAASRDQPFYVVNTDGTGLTRLPVFSGSLAPSPQRVISRDGTVVFAGSAIAAQGNTPAPQNVYRMKLDGTDIRALTSLTSASRSFLQNATVSADGNTVVFESDTQIWIVRGDGTALRQVTTGSDPASSPSLSADGSVLTFIQSGQVYMLRTDSTTLPVALTRFQTSTASDSVISDDGSRVAFVVGPRNGGRGAIYSVKTDGSELRALFAPPTINFNGITSSIPGTPPSAGSLV
ncbi:MAG: LpqB family beta-propeller domain-containing protein, partial [Acidobacteriota bacterium]|nr:LpqB family beta-propeller domain-containing protein [Acidobacteriota bacterium]